MGEPFVQVNNVAKALEWPTWGSRYFAVNSTWIFRCPSRAIRMWEINNLATSFWSRTT
jgi:hypothetical protein